MVTAKCGTFDYTFVVPAGPRTGARQMQDALPQPLQGDLERFLGHAPLLQAVECHREKWQLLSRVTLSAADKKHAIGFSFSFTVDRELIAMLRARDTLYISRAHCARLGLSVLRDGALVGAAGAVMHVPLRPMVSV